VRPAGSTELRTRAELKNMNSFNYIARGIEAEVARQIEVYESGGQVEQETRDYDADTGTLSLHRTKEEAEDYRYFPEPDLVPIEPPSELVERARSELYERVVAAGAEPRAAANVLMNQFAASGVDPATVAAPAELAKLIEARDRIPRASFTEALAASGDPGFEAERYLADGAITDVAELGRLVDEVLAANESQVAAYRAGKEALLGFFVGQVMRATQGKADPKAVNALLREKLVG